MFSNLLKIKTKKKIDLDKDSRIHQHRKIIMSKKILRNLYKEFHSLFYNLDNQYSSAEGIRLELGSGCYSVKENFKDVLSSDIIKTEYYDLTINAQNIALENDSVRSLYLQNTFHHFSDPEKFLNEAYRVLKNDGLIIIIEPYYGFLASLIFPYMHESETFNKKQTEWQNSALSPMKKANQALSYIIFKKNRKQFEAKFPKLQIINNKTINNYLRHLSSGGLNFKQTIPDSFEYILKFFEKLLQPFSNHLALFHVIVIKKVK